MDAQLLPRVVWCETPPFAENFPAMEPIPSLAPIRTILHPSDFTPASEAAFCHALRIALTSGADLTLFHMTEDHHEHWSEIAGVRETLARWNLLAPGSDALEVGKLGLRARKLTVRGEDPVRAVRRRLDEAEVNLIVLATHSRDGMARWLHPSTAEPIAREAHTLSLFIPEGGREFVSRESGAVLLRHVLVPVAATPSPQDAVWAAARLARAVGAIEATFHLLHVGEPDGMPEFALPAGEEERWNWRTREGSVVETIVAAAADISADLIVMATDGHHGFLDALRGNTTERVLRAAKCALLAVPSRA
jgi:nucleotide-binding universal stress UspA family protein